MSNAPSVLQSNAVVVGIQWGDEGKGKIVDLLARGARYTVRFQGGNNAGHTLVVEGETLILHLVPSGILQPDTTCVMGNGMVVDPLVLVGELDALAARGKAVAPERLRISSQAHVILPYHRDLDACREEARGGKQIGTTRKGIGPCYEDRSARRGIRFETLLDPDALRVALESVLPEKNRMLREWYGVGGHKLEALLAWAAPLAERLRPHVDDTVALLHGACARGERILFEGAQGTFLDVDHGTYPFVTSSNTVAAAAATGSGVGPRDLHAVVGIAKAYTTRVGAGPFPSELDEEAAETLRQKGGEFGATTGRPRRCGWFDAALVRHACALNGVTHLVLTKLDVLSGIGPLQICTSYAGGGVPAGAEALARVTPTYEDHPGWDEDITGCRTYEELPAAARSYVERIEALCGARVGLVSVGPGREQVIPLDPLFER